MDLAKAKQQDDARQAVNLSGSVVLLGSVGSSKKQKVVASLVFRWKGAGVEVTYLAVLPEYRKRGIADKLLSELRAMVHACVPGAKLWVLATSEASAWWSRQLMAKATPAEVLGAGLKGLQVFANTALMVGGTICPDPPAPKPRQEPTRPAGGAAPAQGQSADAAPTAVGAGAAAEAPAATAGLAAAPEGRAMRVRRKPVRLDV
jgi:Acetyltransferase (GNAT) family